MGASGAGGPGSAGGAAALEAALAAGEVRLEGAGLTYRFTRSLAGGGLPPGEVTAALPAARAAGAAFARIVATGETAGMTEPVLWPRVLDDAALAPLEAFAARARGHDLVLSVGIGGSYLGNRVLRDALLGPGWNALPRAARGDRPELHFTGQHLDPLEARALLPLVRARAAAQASAVGGGGPLRVLVLAISKSGTTTETLATTLGLLEALGATPGVEVGLAALTAPGSVLSALVAERRGEALPFPEGIGGRWSVLSACGLVTAALTGVDCRALLAGARAAAAATAAASAGGGDPARDPALLYALLHHLHGRRGRTGAVFMPYAERLRCVSEWYVQLLAESLGKANDRAGRAVHAGRTPIVAVGTTDMHAQTQLHQEGPKDKTVTTLDVLDWGPATVADRVPEVPVAGALAGRTFGALNTLAREANEEALHGSGRPSDAWLLDRLDARTLGALLWTLMASVAYEGELLDVCAYDQPGVEAYKKIMRARL